MLPTVPSIGIYVWGKGGRLPAQPQGAWAFPLRTLPKSGVRCIHDYLPSWSAARLATSPRNLHGQMAEAQYPGTGAEPRPRVVRRMLQGLHLLINVFPLLMTVPINNYLRLE